MKKFTVIISGTTFKCKLVPYHTNGEPKWEIKIISDDGIGRYTLPGNLTTGKVFQFIEGQAKW